MKGAYVVIMMLPENLKKSKTPSWNSAFCRYQVTHSVLFLPPFIYHPPCKNRIKLVHIMVPACTAHLRYLMFFSKVDWNMQPPFWSCPITVGCWRLQGYYQKGENSSLKTINFRPAHRLNGFGCWFPVVVCPNRANVLEKLLSLYRINTEGQYIGVLRT